MATDSVRRDERSGLTILELMVALAILGLLLALVPPALDGVSSRWRLRTAAQHVAATVQWARNAASIEDRPVEVLYDVPDDSFWVRDGQQTHAFHSLPRGVHLDWVRFGSIEVTGDVASCTALPDGTVDAHQVMLRSDDDAEIRISFDRLTGEPFYDR